MEYIDLTLRKYSKQEFVTCTLNEAVNSKITVILGTPGSGKTSILKKYKLDHPKSHFYTVKELLRLHPEIGEDCKNLLVDGLDEYRSLSHDKTFVVNELSEFLKAVPVNTKIIITCREMDWYGENDETALKDKISTDVTLFSILPLELIQKEKLSKILGIKNSDEFIEKFSPLGFLDNPQMFMMTAEISADSQNISTKKDLYLEFIKRSKEHNPSYVRNKLHTVEPQKLLKITGYLAFYFIFTDIDNCNDEYFLDEVCDSERGFNREDIETVLNTKLFKSGNFIHRSIAEFSAAYYIQNYKINSNYSIETQRIKALFTKEKRIPTQLRGTFAWLCSLSKNEELIGLDPYYQAVYGDNSFWDNELKKKVTLCVKEYSFENPYFFKAWNMKILDGFYTPDLDDFFIDEFEESLKIEGSYTYFITSIFNSAESLSSDITNFIKKQIRDVKSEGYYKRELVYCIESEVEFLKEVLDLIRNGNIEDDSDHIKEGILGLLYPHNIDHTEVIKYLDLYKTDVGGYCYFLYDTPYVNQFELVNSIYKISLKDENNKPKFPINTEGFIEDYFFETYLKYPKDLSSKEIYEIIKHFRQYYKHYEKLPRITYRKTLTAAEEETDNKLNILADELFSLYVDEQIIKNDKEKLHPVMFEYFFYKHPLHYSEILISKMDKSLDDWINCRLFFSSIDKNNVTIDFEKIASDFGLAEDYELYLNRPKQEWQIRQEKREKKIREKT